MKRAVFLLIFLCGIAPTVVPAQPISPQALLNEVKAAFREKNPEKLLALTYFKGNDESDRDALLSIYKGTVFDHFNKLSEIALGQLPVEYSPTEVSNGFRYEVTAPPAGMVFLHYDTSPSLRPEFLINLNPYALIDGKYYLVTMKATRLDWNGPPDQSLSCILQNGRYTKTTFEVEWNASGVNQTRTFHTASAFVTGQYLSRVTAVSGDDNPDKKLLLFVGDHQFFASKSFDGPKTITYTK